MNKIFKNVKNNSIFKKVKFQKIKNVIKNLNYKYKKSCEKNRELPSIITIGVSMIFVVVLTLILTNNTSKNKK